MIHITAKTDTNSSLRVRLLSVAAALAASALFIAALGYNPFVVLGNIVTGSTATFYRLSETVRKAVPLTILSLGTAVAFRMKFWNIGGEGQFIMGAFGATLVALRLPNAPQIVLLPLMFASGVFFSALWAFIPALLKIKFTTNETLVTLMLNYVAQKWISFLQYGPWKDPNGNGFPKIANFSDNASLPLIFGIHSGWLIALVLAALLALILKKTKLGYEIDVLGESEATARYAGMNVTGILIAAMILSGGLCGVAGVIQASGVEHTLTEQISGGLGFTAVITTWLAQLSPLVIVIVSFLFSMLIRGGEFLQSSMQIPAAIAQILQGIIIFFVLGGEFFIRYRIQWRKNK